MLDRGKEIVDIPTDHRSDDPRIIDPVEFSRCDLGSIPKNQIPISDSPDFLEEVTDVKNRHATFPQCVDGQEESFGVLFGQRTRGLVEDQHTSLGRQTPRDLDQLLPAHWQRTNGPIEIEVGVPQRGKRVASDPSLFGPS